jgi:hypothetical protein
MARVELREGNGKSIGDRPEHRTQIAACWPSGSAHLARTASVFIVLAWAAQMGLLVKRAYLESPTLAADLSRYGAGAQWKGVYYHGEKIGYSVGQTQATADGFELLGVTQLVVPFDQFTNHACLVVHFLRPVNIAVTRAEQAAFRDGRASCRKKNARSRGPHSWRQTMPAVRR